MALMLGALHDALKSAGADDELGAQGRRGSGRL